jgi:hypothetical protein
MINNLLSLIVAIGLVSSCATYSVTTTNPIEETMILIQGDYDELVDSRIDAGKYSINKVSNDNLYKEKQQTSNQLNENWRRMRMIKLPVEAGSIRLKIYSKNGSLVFDKDVYVGKGQVRKIQL